MKLVIVIQKRKGLGFFEKRGYSSEQGQWAAELGSAG